MAIQKQLKGHGDPLLLEVVAGLEKTLSSLRENTPELVDKAESHGVRGLGERTFSTGDPLLHESERYHQAELDHAIPCQVALHEGLLKRRKNDSLFTSHSEVFFDPILQEYVIPRTSITAIKAFEEDMVKKSRLFREMSTRKQNILTHHTVGPHENLLKRDKYNSLFSSHSGAFYDPILHEYILPEASVNELKVLGEDIVKKRQLFREMSVRKRRNLSEQELLCDPLVHPYRLRELMFRSASAHLNRLPATIVMKSEDAPEVGDPLFIASKKYPGKKLASVPAVPTKYRKLNAGDPLFSSSKKYHEAVMHKKYTTPGAAVPCEYRKVNAGDPLLRAVME